MIKTNTSSRNVTVSVLIGTPVICLVYIVTLLMVMDYGLIIFIHLLQIKGYHLKWVFYFDHYNVVISVILYVCTLVISVVLWVYTLVISVVLCVYMLVISVLLCAYTLIISVVLCVYILVISVLLCVYTLIISVLLCVYTLVISVYYVYIH